MVFVMFVALVIGVASVSLIHTTSAEITSGATQRQRVDLYNTTESALDIAMGRLRLIDDTINPVRSVWEPELFTAGVLMDTAVNGVSVSAKLKEAPSGPYDSIANPTAVLEIVAGDGARSLYSEVQIRNANVADYQYWYGDGALAGTSSWVMPFSSADGRVFIEGRVAGVPVSQLSFANIAITSSFFGKVTMGNATTGPNLSAPYSGSDIGEGQVFRAGWQTLVPQELPALDPDATRFAELASRGTPHYYTVDATEKFQIRIHGSQYDYRVVTDQYDGATPWTTTAIPQDGVIYVKDASDIWPSLSPIPLPETNIIRAYEGSVPPSPLSSLVHLDPEPVVPDANWDGKETATGGGAGGIGAPAGIIGEVTEATRAGAIIEPPPVNPPYTTYRLRWDLKGGLRGPNGQTSPWPTIYALPGEVLNFSCEEPDLYMEELYWEWNAIDMAYDYTIVNTVPEPPGTFLYRFVWTDGTWTTWGSSRTASHSWTNPGNNYIVLQIRRITPAPEVTKKELMWAGSLSVQYKMPIDNSDVLSTDILLSGSYWSDGGSTRIEIVDPVETIATPTISGPVARNVGELGSYTAAGASSSKSHAIQYYIDWGDGTNTGWQIPDILFNEVVATHSWGASGTYIVRAQARCPADSEYSNWASMNVDVTAPETVSVPNVTGPNVGITGTSYTFTAQGSVSSELDPIQYRLRWRSVSGAWTYYPWNSNPIALSWPAADTYQIQALARCATHTTILSPSWSAIHQIVISNPAIIIPPSTFGTPAGVQVWVDNSADPATSWAPSQERANTGFFNQARAIFTGKLTIATTGSIEVLGSIKYSDPANDTLGLIAQNNIWLRNDSLLFFSGAASDRIQQIDATMTCGRGGVFPVWRWEDGLSASRAPAIVFNGNRHFAATVPSYSTIFVAASPDTALLVEAQNLADEIALGYQTASQTFDARVLENPPPAFRKVFNTNPVIIPDTRWDTFK